jgi:ubiquinone biosynthesis protein UbiJ
MKFLFSLAEKALNQYIQLDPASVAQFAGLADKVLLVEETRFQQSIYFVFNTTGCCLLPNYSGHVDVIVRGPVLSLIKLAQSSQNVPKSLFSSQVEIIGDTQLAQKIGTVFRHIEIDWEEYLSHVTGDVIAHQLGNFLRNFVNFNKNVAISWRKNLTEYIQEEQHYVPSRVEIEDFFKDVDQVREEVERLEARFLALQQKIGATLCVE